MLQIYWIGPLLGTLIASGFYIFMIMLEYEAANPGQDADKKPHIDDSDKRGAERLRGSDEHRTSEHAEPNRV